MSTTSPKYSNPVRWRLLFETNWRNVRYACRSLARSPGFTAIAILILALGVGMTASVFSVAEPLLSRPLPVRDSGSLLLLRTANPAQADYSDRVPDEMFYRLAGSSTTLSGVFGFLPLPERSVVEMDTALDRVQAHLVTGAYFSVLGVNAVVGRTLAESDDDFGAPDVAVISHRLWQRHFNGNSDVVGKTIRIADPNLGLDRPAVIVVGIAPPGFYGVDVDSDPDVWMPFRVVNRPAFPDNPRLGGVGGLRVMGRVHDGLRVAAVQAEIDVLASQLPDQDVSSLRDETGRFHLLAEPGGRGYSRLRYEFLEPVVALSAAVGVVLLIVWTNLAALMLGRGAFRSREMAIRLALGSDRRRLLGLFLTEGLILALAGGILGFIFAFWGTEFLTSWLPPESVLASRIQPGWRTLVFTGAVSMLGMVLFAFLPGVKGANRAIASPAAGPSGRTGRRGAFAMGHRIAVVAQVALSLCLLIGMGLFLRTLRNLSSVDVGFDEHEVLQFEIEASPQRLIDFAEVGLARVGSLPGAQSTSYYYGTQGLLQEGIVLPPLELSLGPGGPTVSAREVWVGPRFFETLGIPFVSGRTPREDMGGGPDVLSEGVLYANGGELVLSAGLATRLFDGANPIGRRVFRELDTRDPRRPEVPVFERFDVAGVVGDVRHLSLRGQPESTVYSFIATPQRFLVRAEGDAAALVPAVRRAVDEFDPELRITNAVTLAQIREASVAPERFVAQVAALFALSSLMLAAMGTYGVFSYATALRRAELGIRMALGARRGTVIAMFMRDTVRTLGPGVVLGLLAALGTTRLLNSMLFGVTPMDPLSVIAATVVLAAAAVFAAYVPVRRASGLDPMLILRDE